MCRTIEELAEQAAVNGAVSTVEESIGRLERYLKQLKTHPEECRRCDWQDRPENEWYYSSRGGWCQTEAQHITETAEKLQDCRDELEVKKKQKPIMEEPWPGILYGSQQQQDERSEWADYYARRMKLESMKRENHRLKILHALWTAQREDRDFGRKDAMQALNASSMSIGNAVTDLLQSKAMEKRGRFWKITPFGCEILKAFQYI